MGKHMAPDSEPPWLSDEVYKTLGWIVGTLLPASVTLVGVLGPVFGWHDTDQVQTVLSALATFLGTVFNLRAPGDGFTRI